MASPVIAGSISTNGTGAAVNKLCTLPTNITAGNLLLLCLRSAGADTHSTPSGWTSLFLNSTADASDDTTSLWYRQADGGEGASVNVLCTGSVKYAGIAYRITGHENPATQAPQFAPLATGTSNAPNPNVITPTGGAKDYLFIWWGSWEGEQTSPPTGDPSGYVGRIGATSGTGGAITTNCKMAASTKSATASSEDAPQWTISVSDDWTVTVVAVHPGAALSAVGKSSAYNYDVLVVAGRGASLAYSVAQLAGRSAALAYDMDGAVGRSLVSAYDMNNLAARSMAFASDTFVLAGRSAALAYDMAQLAGRSHAFHYDLEGLAAVGNSIIIEYDLNGVELPTTLVRRSLDLRYKLGIFVPKYNCKEFTQATLPPVSESSRGSIVYVNDAPEGQKWKGNDGAQWVTLG